MAQMIPRQPPQPGGGAEAERILYEALQAQLDDEWFVYNRLSFVERSRAGEGEADFLIVHREKGILLVECKGKGVRRKRNGAWVRRDGNLEKELRESPMDQAQRAIKLLARALEERAGELFPGLKRLPLAHGHVVAFPRALAAEGNLPLNAYQEIFWDSSDLAQIGQRVTEALAFWGKAAPKMEPLAPREFKRFRHKILNPLLNVVECIGASIHADQQTMVQLGQEQVHVLDMFIQLPRVRVLGGAGTGKTILAVEAARRLAEKDHRVLLLCFNKRLGNQLARKVEALDLDKGRIVATTFHRLSAGAFRQHTGGDLHVPQDRPREVSFWNDTAPELLLEAIAAGQTDRFDAIVVDEGQDFAETWWQVLEELYEDQEQGRMLVFFDPAQEIFGRGCHVPEMTELKLTRNFRNTRCISQVVSELGQVELAPYERCPLGEPPVVQKQESTPRTVDAVTQLVERLIDKERLQPDQIAILTPHTRDHSCLAGLEKIGRYKLADKPLDRAGKLLHTTISAFKGIESDVVILLDIDPRDERCSRNARYVAASRAKHRLFVFAKKDWMD